MADRPTVVSLFSGGGGLDLGLEAAGFEVRVSSDIDPFSCATLRNGAVVARRSGKSLFRKHSVIERDICELSGADLLDAAGLQPDRVDLLAGGPPCQAFSVFGKRKGRSDPRGRLVFEYLRILTEIRPTSFLVENVFGLLTVDNGRTFAELCERLGEPTPGLKYEVTVHRLDAVDYGVPQFRDRVFIFGSRTGVPVASAPAAWTSSGSQGLLTHKTLPGYRTVADGLRGLPLSEDKTIANHTGRNHSQRIIDRYDGLEPGERDHFTRINRLDLERPSYTIIVGSDKGGGKGHVHPTLPREVTPRESARMQTFPDWWAFTGTSRHPIRQVGNAVPPLLGAAVGNAIRSQLFGMRKKSMKQVLQSLDQAHLFDR